MGEGDYSQRIALEKLKAGQIDAVLGFSFRVYVDLKDRGVPVDDIVLMMMADYGLKLYGNAVIVNPKFAAEKPDAVKAFLSAYLRGLKETIRRPADAIDLTIKREDMARNAVELERREYLPSADILLFVIALTGSAMLLPLYAVEAVVRDPFELTVTTWSAVVYLATFPTLLAVFTWNLALRSVGPNRAAIFVNLIPVSGAALAMILLGERLHLYHLLGAAFVLTGIYFAVRRA